MIQIEKFHHKKALILENASMRVVCLPDFGGKLVSLFDKQLHKEFLFQNPKKSFRHADLGSKFADFEACGFDEAFPSIDSGEVYIENSLVHYPDHGEIWSACFQEKMKNEVISLEFSSKLLPYRYEKNFSLDEQGLQITYEITNTGKVQFPCIWTLHCLLDYEKGMNLLFPPDTKEAVNVFSSSCLGEQGAILPFPIFENPKIGLIDLRTVDSHFPCEMEKYYINHKISKGLCGMHYSQTNTTIWFEYDENKLPYLGFWKTLGGYRGDFNCALEPTNGFFDSIEKSQQNGICPVLLPGGTLKFSLHIRIEHNAREV